MKALFKFVILATCVTGPLDVQAFKLASGLAEAASPRRPRPPSQQQQKQLKRATDAYEAKKFDDSVAILTLLLQKQADYLPARVLLGRCLYQQKKYTELYKLGQGLNLELLEPDARYEFGQGAFKENDYTSALASFVAVPEGHPLFDLAGYYGGISAFKLGDYETSIALLRQAVVLPSKLLRSQKIYLKEAERLLAQKLKQQLQSEKDQDSTPPPAPVPSPSMPPPVSEESVPNPSYRSLRPVRSLSLTPTYMRQNQELGSGLVREREVKSGELRLNLGTSFSSTERAPHFILQSHASLSALEGSSGVLPLLADARQEQSLFLTSREGPQSLIYFEALAGAEWPLATTLSAGLLVGAFSYSVEFIDDATTVTPWLSFFLAQRSGALESKLNIDAYFNSFDGEMRSVNIREQGRATLSLPAHFVLGIQAEGSQYSYEENGIDGPDWFARALFEGGYQLENNFYLFLGGFYEQNFQLLTLAEVGRQLEYDEQRQGFYARSEVALLDFLRIGLIAQNAAMSYDNLSPNRQTNESIFKPLYIQSINRVAVYSSLTVTF